MADPEQYQARKGRLTALVIAGTGAFWILATFIGAEMGWSNRTRALFDLIALAGFFIIVDATQVTVTFSLRAFKDTQFPFLVLCGCYWFLTLPVGYWLGIVMAGDMDDVGSNSGASIRGALVAGQGDAMGNLDIDGGTFQYHSCYVERAGSSLAHRMPVENSWWEDTG